MKDISLNSYKIIFDEKSGRITAISDNENSLDLSGSIWEIETADREILSIDDMKNFSYSIEEKLILTWQKDDFKVIIKFFCEDDKLKSNISVLSPDAFLSKIKYPVYKGIKKLSEDGKDCLLMPWQSGFLIKNPVDSLLNIDKDVPFWMGRGGKKYENDYPAQYSYQYFAYYTENEKGYYIGTEDKDAYIKTTAFIYNEKVDGMDIVYTNYPEGMNEVNCYYTPYNYVFYFFKGDWKTATKLYRKWAIEQKWSTPLKEKNIPQAVKDTDFIRITNREYYYLGTRTEEMIETNRILKEKLRCNISMHWYGWNKAPKHGDWYPEMADHSNKEWQNELYNANKKLTEIGIKKIPYVNVHLWDNKLASFKDEKAEELFILPESKTVIDEPWLEERNLFPVCHGSPRVKNKAMDLFKNVLEKDGFDGIYIDQVASFNASLCFNKEHGHPAGGGKWWVEEYHTMINGLRDIMDKNHFLTTESCCEAYHDLFDLFLLVDNGTQNSGFFELCGTENCVALPLLSMIYHDYVTAYGSLCRFTDSEAQFAYIYMRNIIWGMIPTSIGIELKEIKEDKQKMRILKQGIDFHKKYKNILRYGVMEDYIIKDENSFEIDFHGLVTNCPAAMATIFSYEGKRYFFGYNITWNDRVFSINGKEITVSPRVLTFEEL